jgi:hypothetical protein
VSPVGLLRVVEVGNATVGEPPITADSLLSVTFVELNTVLVTVPVGAAAPEKVTASVLVRFRLYRISA